jgi:hypothetical protein
MLVPEKKRKKMVEKNMKKNKELEDRYEELRRIRGI